MESMFYISLDPGLLVHRIWNMDVHPRLKELLWKDITGSLPLGSSWRGRLQLGCSCSCGSELTLLHIWSGCPDHIITPLVEIVHSHISSLQGHSASLLSLNIWLWSHPWFPLLALRELENSRRLGKPTSKTLKSTRPEREWAVGSLLWLLWTNRMSQVHNNESAPAHLLGPALQRTLLTPKHLRPSC